MRPRGGEAHGEGGGRRDRGHERDARGERLLHDLEGDASRDEEHVARRGEAARARRPSRSPCRRRCGARRPRARRAASRPRRRAPPRGGRPSRRSRPAPRAGAPGARRGAPASKRDGVVERRRRREHVARASPCRTRRSSSSRRSSGAALHVDRDARAQRARITLSGGGGVARHALVAQRREVVRRRRPRARSAGSRARARGRGPACASRRRAALRRAGSRAAPRGRRGRSPALRAASERRSIATGRTRLARASAAGSRHSTSRARGGPPPTSCSGSRADPRPGRPRRRVTPATLRALASTSGGSALRHRAHRRGERHADRRPRRASSHVARRRRGRARRCRRGSRGRRRCAAPRSRPRGSLVSRCVGSRLVARSSMASTPSSPARGVAASAARSVCQARVAHLTRTGYSRTPENTASLPSAARRRPGRVASPVTSAWKRSKSALHLREAPALHRLGHQRRRRRRDRAARALEADVLHARRPRAST